ncbi:MAG: hypothetical protein H0X29_11160 [Parachlamydiaceae bacterium]|nr:hypothetical protein [Parachlamydiaceae bacterium]
MAKTNFTKVEGMLDEGLRKMTVEHLLNLADTAQPESGKPSSKDTPQDALKQANSGLQIILALQRDMKFLDKKGQEPYELFGLNKKTIEKYLKKFETLTPQEWEEINDTQGKVRKFRKDLEKNMTEKDNDDLITQQRRSHVTKRFNINDKWLPLT